MKRHTFHAMGTTFIVVGPDEQNLRSARRRIEAVEAVCTRFDPTSELSRLNQAPAGHVATSSDILAVLRVAETLRDRTDGLFDPAVGANVIAWGYDRTFTEINSRTTHPKLDFHGGWATTSNGVVREPGVRLDLGGIAKGWVCDQIVEAGLAVLASAGGDMRSASADTIAELIDPALDVVAARIPVGVGAAATSSTWRRSWMAGDTRAHHVIDPTTGAPAISPIVTATVTAATAAEAEAGSKAVMLQGVDGLAWCDSADWLTGAAAIWDTGAVYATRSLKVAA
jgi:thiamine biosynthesis lipoprotein